MYAFKMPKYRTPEGTGHGSGSEAGIGPDSNRGERVKRARLEDPATTGSSTTPLLCHNKYSDIPSIYSKSIIGNVDLNVNLGLIEASYAKSTWAKHGSAISSLKNFEKKSNVKCDWPLSLDTVCEYTSWALTDGKLKPNTVRSYLSSLKIVHDLNNFNFVGNNALVYAMIRGAENLEMYKNSEKPSRKVMTLPLLKLIGHYIAKSAWCADSKKTVWCACVIAFFGAFRLGEILPKSQFDCIDMETLLWSDVKFRKDGSILVHIKMDKCKNKKGFYVDLFKFGPGNCCPVTVMELLKNSKYCPSKPVFQFANGKNLCSSLLNKILVELLTPTLGESAKEITGHSFRAGLPSALANNPTLANCKDIKAWGRWSSNSYELYTRLKLSQKKLLFEKIVKVLEN